MSARALLSDADASTVLATILGNNPGMSISTATRVLDQALAFVATAAGRPGEPMVPSRTVDEGWHALILHTGVYQRLCSRFGAFVHHQPEEPDPGRFSSSVLTRTTALITEAGYRVDPDMWRAPDDTLVSVAAKCQHSDDSGPIVIIPKPKPKPKS
ncbi:hypothetical protein GTW66_20700 [Streptomyces sp. SID5473]|uniref:Uncharacterized protein n=2 Tax=Streptomyces TaxID=1883 RepID=A0A7G3UP68_STRT9|nr:hypothetical protein [Streptomyces sp. SID5473]QKM71808.1 hypothetical protein STSU_023150 [Streptomyces tsukubensis NRRL18488]TAI46583.1 hypothetical protein EWI31_05005 [Streptomyces tsukubensis]